MGRLVRGQMIDDERTGRDGRTLAGLLLLATAMAAGGTGCDATRRVTENLTGRTPLRAAVQMEAQDPDQRIRGINRLVDRRFGKQPPYTDRYRQIAQLDPDYLVRATAIRALNRARHREATPLFVRSLTDPVAKIRLEAAKALANLPDPNAVEPLVRLVTSRDEDKDVRIAAANALRHYPQLEVARALVNQLDERDFGVAWQSLRSLQALTSQDFRYDGTAWLNYLTQSQSPFG